VLEHGHGPLVVVAPEQDLAQEREPEAVGAVDLDHAKELALGLLPHVELGVGARQDDPAFEVVGSRFEANAADLDCVLGPPEGQVGLS